MRKGKDNNNDISKKILRKSKIKFTDKIDDIFNSNFFIVTVPTPVDVNKKPNLTSLKKACKLIGPKLIKGSIVIFESTVYPGLTEEICKPILEKIKIIVSMIQIGYSPERINPGDNSVQ